MGYGKPGKATSVSTEYVNAAIGDYTSNRSGIGDVNWATLIGSDGVVNTGANFAFSGFLSIAAGNHWQELYRPVFGFDAHYTDLVAVTFKIYIYEKYDENSANPSWYLYSAWNSTTKLSNALAYASITTGQYNSIVLNAAGIAHFNTVGDKTVFLKTGYDEIGGSEPSAPAANKYTYIGLYLDEKGTIYRPKVELSRVQGSIETLKRGNLRT